MRTYWPYRVSCIIDQQHFRTMSISTNPQTTTNSELPDPKPKPPATLEDQTSPPRPPHPPLQYPDSPRLREHFFSIDFDEPISADEMFRQTTQSPVVKAQKAIDPDGVQKRAEQVPPEIHAGQRGGVRRTPVRRVRFDRSCKNAGNDAAVCDMDDDRKKASRVFADGPWSTAKGWKGPRLPQPEA